MTAATMQRAPTTRDTRPILIICQSASCGPCRHFNTDFVNSPTLQAALSHFQLQMLRMEHRAEKLEACRRNVDRVPTFIVLNHRGHELGRVRGYTDRDSFIAQLTAIVPFRQLQQRRRPPEPSGGRRTAEPSGDRAPPSGSQKRPPSEADLNALKIEQLTKTIEQLNELIASQQSETDSVRSELRIQKDAAAATVQELQQQIAEARAAAAAAETTAAEVKPDSEPEIVSSDSEFWTEPPSELIDHEPDAQTPSEAIGSSDDDSAASTSTWAMWRNLGLKAIQIGLVVAQPHIALPAAGTVSAVVAGIGYWRRLKRLRNSVKGTASGCCGNPAAENGVPAATDSEPFELSTLPFQDIDYSTVWADHWRKEGKSAELAAKEYALFVNAFDAVRRGELALPGISNGEHFAKQIRNWVTRQFQSHVRRQPDNSNPNHRALFAFLHKQAFENIRNGRFNESAPNPKAADVLEDWVNERIVGDIVFNSEA
jgi:hypothetical protein